jgi:hypothetical protein
VRGEVSAGLSKPHRLMQLKGHTSMSKQCHPPHFENMSATRLPSSECVQNKHQIRQYRAREKV